ncbi:MAG: DUF1349 domain-containing protein, partial [Actinobacteria bacterium]|nr:DUF1349 domain-containing protein [Actinomycetota bacterium]
MPLLVGALVVTGLATPRVEAAAGTFVSDDFSSTPLDPRWTVVDPVGDGTVAITGTEVGDGHLELSVPAGTSHDAWKTNRSLRAMQAAADEDFEVEARFDSLPSARYQMQGVLVEQDADDWLRFDFFHDGKSLRAFAAKTVAGSSTALINVSVPSGSPLYLRVARQGGQWTMSYSYDGSAWTTAGSFSHALAVSAIGPFVGNAGSSGTQPAFTASVDYFFNTASPI